VHELLRSDEEVRACLKAHFGTAILTPAGEVSRVALGRRVFSHPDDLEYLESVMHPRVVSEYERFSTELAEAAGVPDIFVVEVPLLYEAREEDRFDRVVVVTAPAVLRRQRAGARIDEREERLISEADKVRRANFVILNDGTLDELHESVAAVWQQLLAETASPR
jgi:dephospho-CoA kinase